MKFGMNSTEVNKPFNKAKFVAALLSLMLLGAIYQIYFDRLHHKEIADQLIKADIKINVLHQENRDLKTSIEQNSILNLQFTNNTKLLNGKIGAFAKQAAICNSLREQMHISQ